MLGEKNGNQSKPAEGTFQNTKTFLNTVL